MKFKCVDCGKELNEKNALATGFNDDKGNSEVVCFECDRERSKCELCGQDITNCKC